MKKFFKKEKGITMITLVLTVIVMMIIVSTLSFYVLNSIQTENFQNMKADILEIEGKALAYYNEKGELPIFKEDVKTMADIGIKGNESFFNQNDGGEYAKVNLDLIGVTPSYKTTYYINTTSFTVYAVDAVSIKGTEYHRPAEKFAKFSTGIPEGLEVGSYVLYEPSGSYKWEAKYYSSTKTPGTDDIILYTGDKPGETQNNMRDMSIGDNKWRVLSINESTGEVELVPARSTTKTVPLQGAQGYNNGVLLLNQACNALYSSTVDGKEIKARSINREDIEEYFSEELLSNAHKYVSGMKYGNQLDMTYTKGSTSMRYPVIFGHKELNVVVKEEDIPTRLDATLRLSEQERLIERSEGTETEGSAGTIILNDGESIQLIQSYYNIQPGPGSGYMKGTYDKYSYRALLLGQVDGPGAFWIATRYFSKLVGASQLSFGMCNSSSANLTGKTLWKLQGSSGNAQELSLFPVITLDGSFIALNDVKDGERPTFKIISESNFNDRGGE